MELRASVALMNLTSQISLQLRWLEKPCLRSRRRRVDKQLPKSLKVTTMSLPNRAAECYRMKKSRRFVRSMHSREVKFTRLDLNSHLCAHSLSSGLNRKIRLLREVSLIASHKTNHRKRRRRRRRTSLIRMHRWRASMWSTSQSIVHFCPRVCLILLRESSLRRVSLN
jgi:hypothetical protein